MPCVFTSLFIDRTVFCARSEFARVNGAVIVFTMHTRDVMLFLNCSSSSAALQVVAAICSEVLVILDTNSSTLRVNTFITIIF